MMKMNSTLNTTIYSAKRGTLIVTAPADVPILVKPDTYLLWADDVDSDWCLIVGDQCPDWKLATMADREGIGFDELVRIRDGLLEV